MSSEEKTDVRERTGFLESVERIWNQKFRVQLERTVDDTVLRLRIPNREQVQELQKRVERLEARMAALQGKR